MLCEIDVKYSSGRIFSLEKVRNLNQNFKYI